VKKSPDFITRSESLVNDDGVVVNVIDADGLVVAKGQGTSGTLTVENAILWWPYSMNKEKFGYRYTLKV
jgi:beta-galactosidase/beta-glucuronidase